MIGQWFAAVMISGGQRALDSAACRFVVLLLLAAFVWFPAAAGAVPCQVPDNGSGTVNLPPPGCGYLSPSDVHMIIDGLPPGTTIQLGIQHRDFFNVTTIPGGSLNGEIEQFSSFLFIQMQGTGGLSGFTKNVPVQIQCETHVAPRSPGAPVQSFDTDMFMAQGQLPPGDPDFDLLRITAGTGFGMPSPGHTTLTRLPGGDWNVDSFFDITYRIDFVGHPGGPLGGMSGSTTGTIRMGAGEAAPVPPCTVVDNGGTVNLPPDGCGYVSPQDLHMMIQGLPPGTEINLAVEHRGFFNVVRLPGGSLGGEIERFGSGLTLMMNGTGELQGFHRLLTMQVQCETHTGPRIPGNPVQSFDTDMFRAQGQLPPGDPDFDLLRITAGSSFGMPSPGHTTLTRLPGGDWNVDSFFDITYRIDFIGASGGPLGGRSGSTTGTIRMQAGQPAGPTAIDEQSSPVAGTRLLVSRPNPFNPSTTIDFELGTAGDADVTVYDVNGRLIRHLVDAPLEAGKHSATWDGRDAAGKEVGSGSYYFQLTVNGRFIGVTKGMILK